jgi:hypothetical protein
MMDFAMAASQNAQVLIKLFLQKMTKNIRFCINFIFHHRVVVKQDHYMTHLLSYAPPLCSRTDVVFMLKFSVIRWLVDMHRQG